MAKQKKWTGGIVYSTHPLLQHEEEEIGETLPPHKQCLILKLDTKQRAGKVVTLIQNFIGRETDIEQLSKTIKQKCGTGGGVKNNEILIQGDYIVKIEQLLKQMGYQIKIKR